MSDERFEVPYPTLCLVTDNAYGSGRALVEKVRLAVEGGATMVQVRAKEEPASRLYDLAVRIKEAINDRALLIVNDRADVAVACDADGVQLGEDALPVSVARRIIGVGPLVGRSVHSVAGAQTAEREGADFLILGAIFPTPSHPSAAPAGLNLLHQVRESVTVPLLAIGGVNRANVASAMAYGATGAAVISAILASADPRGATQELLHGIKAGIIHREAASPGVTR